MQRIGTCVLALLALGCSRRVPFGTDGESGTGTSSSGTSTGTAAPTSTSGTTAGSASGGATSVGSGSTSSTTGSDFVMSPDGTSHPYCDPHIQDCADGEKCSGYDPAGGGDIFGGFKCVPLDPEPVDLFEPCQVGTPGVADGVDNCGVGMFCFELDENGEGVCWAYCQASEVGSYDYECPDESAPPGFLCQHCPCMCIKQCDPILQDCKDGSMCLSRGGGEQWTCVADASGDEGQYGDPCEYINVCDPGLYCANAEYVPNCPSPIGCCTEYCDLTVPDPDTQCAGQADGVVCTPWYEQGMAPPDYEHVGVCVLPP